MLARDLEAMVAMERVADFAVIATDDVDENPFKATVVAPRPIERRKSMTALVPLLILVPRMKASLIIGASLASRAAVAAAATVAFPIGREIHGFAIHGLLMSLEGTRPTKGLACTRGCNPRRPMKTAAAVRVACPTDLTIGQLLTFVKL